MDGRVGGGRYSWRDRSFRPKHFQVDSRGSRAPCLQALGQLSKECWWAAQVEIRVASHTQPLKQRRIHVSDRVVIHVGFILWVRLAVGNMASAVYERLQKRP